VAGTENMGTGGNRNRVLEAISHQAIIHCVDADMRLESGHNAEIARDIMPPDGMGFIGGLVVLIRSFVITTFKTWLFVCTKRG